MGLSLSTTFGDVAATDKQKNQRIGRILGRGDIESTSARLRNLTTSITLTPDYHSYILNASVRGVKDYLQGYVDQTNDHNLVDLKVDPQALHNAIMVHASSINTLAVDEGLKHWIGIPEVAKIENIDYGTKVPEGYHATERSSVTRSLNFKIGVNQASDSADIVNIVAHETAHHIECKIGLIHRWNESAVPAAFKTDAAYFASLGTEGAYISGHSGNHSLYEGQANERMAREAGDAAQSVFQDFLPKKPF